MPDIMINDPIMSVLNENIKIIFSIANIKNNIDLDAWCGNDGRHRLYDEVVFLLHQRNGLEYSNPDMIVPQHIIDQAYLQLEVNVNEEHHRMAVHNEVDALVDLLLGE